MRAVPLLAALSLTLVAGSAQAEGGESRKKGGGLSYTQFPTLTATVMRPNGRRGVLTVEAGIDTPDTGLKARADVLEPRLRDAYVTVLATFAAGLTPGTPPNVDLLADRLQQATDRVIGKPGSKLLIGTVLVN